MASVAAMGLPAVLRARSANERLNIALVGVGGRGADNLHGVAGMGWILANLLFFLPRRRVEITLELDRRGTVALDHARTCVPAPALG
jgi:hypothetical protein